MELAFNEFFYLLILLLMDVVVYLKVIILYSELPGLFTLFLIFRVGGYEIGLFVFQEIIITIIFFIKLFEEKVQVFKIFRYFFRRLRFFRFDR